MQTATAPTSKFNGSVQKDQTSLSVLKTTNYDKFKTLDNNRVVNKLHLRRLVDSFKENCLISPILVNDKLQVIDGQHRLMAAKETGNPVYYIVIPGYGIKEVTILNANQKDWNKTDYLHMFVAEGVEPYVILHEFMQTFPDFTIQPAERIIRLLGGKGRSQYLDDGTKMEMRDFQEGKLFIPDVQKSYSVGRKIMDFKPFFRHFATGKFVSAVMPLIMKSKLYNHKEMIHKLSNCPIKLRVCNEVTEYRALLEDIYNYKRLKDNKVSFKYE